MNKYPRMFLRQIEALVFIILQIFFATREVFDWRLGNIIGYSPTMGNDGYKRTEIQNISAGPPSVTTPIRIRKGLNIKIKEKTNTKIHTNRLHKILLPAQAFVLITLTIEGKFLNPAV